LPALTILLLLVSRSFCLSIRSRASDTFRDSLTFSG
jgi:hypothetical protein